MTTLGEIQAAAFDNSERHGFHDPRPSFGDLIALIHSEASEALEAYREGVLAGIEADGKPIGIGSELADIIIRVADTAGIIGLDLERAVIQKMAYNLTRPYRHGGKRL